MAPNVLINILKWNNLFKSFYSETPNDFKIIPINNLKQFLSQICKLLLSFYETLN